MKKIQIIQTVGIVVSILLMTAVYVSAFSMSSGGVSSSGSGGFSSSSSTSSPLGFSSDTLVMTGGSPSKPAASPTPAGGPGAIPTSERIPAQWQPGTRSGTFFDPITQTSWFFDNVLQKFYTPTYGWFLVTQHTKEGKVYAQFYYDPKSGVFRDMTTGTAMMSPAGGTTGAASSGEQPGFVPPFGQTTPASSGTPPIVAAGQPSGGTTSVSSAHPCRIVCVSCPSGFCDDCNQNGVCDDSESTLKTEPTGTQTGGMNEKPQEPIQINVPVTPPAVSAEGGLSEEAQSTIYYQLALPESGLRPIVACDPYQDCEYCLDIDDDGACTLLDYAIIFCKDRWGLDYMGARDDICDIDVLLVMDCETPSECTIAEFCKDMNGDGFCDEESEHGSVLL